MSLSKIRQLLYILCLLGSGNMLAQELSGPKQDTDRILQLTKQFSKSVMASDYDAIANAYTADGKIFPNNTDIIAGTAAIKTRWTLPKGLSIPYHRVMPEEIKVIGDYAYDYGRYEGKTRQANGKENSWKGKYVIVWKKVNKDWKIYLDIWNRIKEPEQSQPKDPMAEHLQHSPNNKHPYGKLAPNTPAALADFAPMIGTCDCRSLKRLSQTEWADTVNMVWSYKYIMNGWAVQDESWDETGSYNSSIRQYIPDSSSWYVTFFSAKTPSSAPSTWVGSKTADGKILLNRPQKAPNGMEGKYRITFYDITEDGFSWEGAWTTPDESFVYKTWKIWCTKRKE